MQHHSIHSHQTFLQGFFLNESPVSADDKVQEIGEQLIIWHDIAIEHGARVFLFLANGYLQLTSLASRLENKEQIQKIYCSVWKYLILAKRSESHSSEAIHNAYFDQGLTLSNIFRLDIIDGMLNACDPFIKKDDKSLAEREANFSYHAFFMEQIRDCKTITWTFMHPGCY